ncbi:helix-turn-helix domain-containing protein [Herbaspirillum sp. WKF16]|jgi:DNA-binding HxlR family transcriptional regulator|uniref:winged helix-turn-helix transcriptional regulator n=1 Tax=Herbaspirillum sp. WKF16 TaxID=3028312 RepID=UPI0023A961A1|nr:helix-turn-helix domain-containing protein [Herbaspirillum sp. WKF16]WDZ96002.1 helix-turn-helix domain-containing protein [Herbaspirillum sp. WKF16]
MPAEQAPKRRATSGARVQAQPSSLQDCPVARTLQLIGEWWTVLIVRDAFAGKTRFDQFRRSLDISPAILTKRLQALVDAGIMVRRRYNDHPPRDEYLLTDSGRALRPVIAALRDWGEQHFGRAQIEAEEHERAVACGGAGENAAKRAQ